MDRTGAQGRHQRTADLQSKRLSPGVLRRRHHQPDTAIVSTVSSVSFGAFWVLFLQHPECIKTRLFELKNQTFLGEGAVLTPHTLPLVGRGTPSPYPTLIGTSIRVPMALDCSAPPLPAWHSTFKFISTALVGTIQQEYRPR